MIKERVLLIIGNGFDLNLGLKTAYSDFICSDQFNKRTNNNQPNYLKDFIKNKYDIENWIDLEIELAKYVNSIPEFGYKADSFLADFFELKASLRNYIGSLNTSEINKNSAAFDYLDKLNPTYYNNSGSELIIFNFNYTFIVNKINFPSLFRNWRKVKIINVHGTVEEDNIIFGISDFNNLNIKYNVIRKSFAINYGNNIKFQDLFEITSLKIFGHSLGESDHNYIKHFFHQDTLINKPSVGLNFEVTFYGNESLINITNQLWKLTNKKLGAFKQINNCNFIDILNYKIGT